MGKKNKSKPTNQEVVEIDTNEEQSAKDFPPGLAPKMLSMLNGINAIREQFSELVKHPHHEILAKVRLKIL